MHSNILLQAIKQTEGIKYYDDYMLEYFIEDNFVQVEKYSNNKLSITIENKVSGSWIKQNIYDLALFKLFVRVNISELEIELSN